MKTGFINEMTGDDVANILAEQPNNKDKGVGYLKDRWVASKVFTLKDIPVESVSPATIVEEGAKPKTRGPIIVDLNIAEVGRLGGRYGAPPEAIVLDGKHRLSEAKKQGKKTIQAYVGARADKHISRVKKEIDKHDEKVCVWKEKFLDPNNKSPGSALRQLNQLLPEYEITVLREQRKALLAKAD